MTAKATCKQNVKLIITITVAGYGDDGVAGLLPLPASFWPLMRLHDETEQLSGSTEHSDFCSNWPAGID